MATHLTACSIRTVHMRAFELGRNGTASATIDLLTEDGNTVATTTIMSCELDDAVYAAMEMLRAAVETLAASHVGTPATVADTPRKPKGLFPGERLPEL